MVVIVLRIYGEVVRLIIPFVCCRSCPNKNGDDVGGSTGTNTGKIVVFMVGGHRIVIGWYQS